MNTDIAYRVISDGNSDQFENSSYWQHMITNVDFVDYNSDGNTVQDFEVKEEYAKEFEHLLNTDNTVISYTVL